MQAAYKILPRVLALPDPLFRMVACSDSDVYLSLTLLSKTTKNRLSLEEAFKNLGSIYTALREKNPRLQARFFKIIEEHPRCFRTLRFEIGRDLDQVVMLASKQALNEVTTLYLRLAENYTGNICDPQNLKAFREIFGALPQLEKMIVFNLSSRLLDEIFDAKPLCSELELRGNTTLIETNIIRNPLLDGFPKLKRSVISIPHYHSRDTRRRYDFTYPDQVKHYLEETQKVQQVVNLRVILTNYHARRCFKSGFNNFNENPVLNVFDREISGPLCSELEVLELDQVLPDFRDQENSFAFSSLKSLILQTTRIEDVPACVSGIAKISPRLETVTVFLPQSSSDDLSAFFCLNKIKRLRVCVNAVSDRAVPNLFKQLPQLDSLEIFCLAKPDMQVEDLFPAYENELMNKVKKRVFITFHPFIKEPETFGLDPNDFRREIRNRRARLREPTKISFQWLKTFRRKYLGI